MSSPLKIDEPPEAIDAHTTPTELADIAWHSDNPTTRRKGRRQAHKNHSQRHGRATAVRPSQVGHLLWYLTTPLSSIRRNNTHRRRSSGNCDVYDHDDLGRVGGSIFLEASATVASGGRRVRRWH